MEPLPPCQSRSLTHYMGPQLAEFCIAIVVSAFDCYTNPPRLTGLKLVHVGPDIHTKSQGHWTSYQQATIHYLLNCKQKCNQVLYGFMTMTNELVIKNSLNLIFK